ncbi:hypothetical protein Clacol_008964 [Clathrus columnatus]|uniref:FAD-dependent oxidoreductase 2 FAD-binding domain-containing protein n=1 Tax=Clathrus columnatus TaxID=1419009 RepID=A0AAV5ALX7_9AGAM|nr:hypothetical protein Clacol_008964 [Clathrus columnatus]
MLPWQYQCIILGTGNAALCTAISAVESGCDAARILIIDSCPPSWAGGNTFFTAAAYRTCHEGLSDLLSIVQKIETDEERLKRIDVEPYTKSQFMEDIFRLGSGKSNPALVSTLVEDSREIVGWLAHDVGVRFMLSTHRQAYDVGGRFKFWGGLVLTVPDGGKGLIHDLMKKVTDLGIRFKWETTATELYVEDSKHVRGVRVKNPDGSIETLKSRAVVLACGGFEANPQMRAEYLGDQWINAHVRGTPYNKGDGFKLVRDLPVNLRPDFVGDWGGCHSTCWDFNSSRDEGSRNLTNAYTKSGYPLGLMINALGKRYVDEGADFRNYTYAIYGKATLTQPGGFAFQVWDNKSRQKLRVEEYGDEVTTKVQASSVEELAELLEKEGLEDKQAFVATINEYNEAVETFNMECPNKTFDPSVKDGLGTQSSSKKLPIPKSNWAVKIQEPPFISVKITCGITFTFGGLPIDATTAGVKKGNKGEIIDGLFAAGEIVGDIFWGNYPGGSGLTAGAVFGRRAGREIGALVGQSEQ